MDSGPSHHRAPLARAWSLGTRQPASPPSLTSPACSVATAAPMAMRSVTAVHSTIGPDADAGAAQGNRVGILAGTSTGKLATRGISVGDPVPKSGSEVWTIGRLACLQRWTPMPTAFTSALGSSVVAARRSSHGGRRSTCRWSAARQATPVSPCCSSPGHERQLPSVAHGGSTRRKGPTVLPRLRTASPCCGMPDGS